MTVHLIEATPESLRRHTPRLGEHTVKVMREAGRVYLLSTLSPEYACHRNMQNLLDGIGNRDLGGFVQHQALLRSRGRRQADGGTPTIFLKARLKAASDP